VLTVSYDCIKHFVRHLLINKWKCKGTRGPISHSWSSHYLATNTHFTFNLRPTVPLLICSSSAVTLLSSLEVLGKLPV